MGAFLQDDCTPAGRQNLTGFLSKPPEAETGDTESEQDSGGSGQSLSLKAQVMETDKPEFKSLKLENLLRYESSNLAEPQFFRLQNGDHYDYGKYSLSLLSARH